MISDQEKLARRLCREAGYREHGPSRLHVWKWQEYLDEAYEIMSARRAATAADRIKPPPEEMKRKARIMPTKPARILDVGSHNPRLQCACCGRWMRLHSRDGKVQRFYGSCYFTGGDHAAARPGNTDVCDACCREKCRAIASPQSFGVAD